MQRESRKCSLLIYNIPVCWTCPVSVVLCLLQPTPHRTPPCIHSNTHTCTKYVSCCILATSKVIIERAKELACCRAADLIPALEKQEGRYFHCVAQHSTSIFTVFKCKLCFNLVASVFDLTSRSDILFFVPQNVCVSLFAGGEVVDKEER